MGFKVFTPLRIQNEARLLLVDRGWIAKGSLREDIPDISIGNSFNELSGLLVQPELGFVLSDDLISELWPKISQTQSLDYLAKAYKVEPVSYPHLTLPTILLV